MTARASYFSDDAMIRRVLREYAVALSGPRALLMMAAHPVAFEGFFMSTGSLADPYARLERTARVMDEIVWGSRAKADRYTARVRAAHASFRGVLPEDAGRFAAGTAYRADDPELLLWIVACLVDSALLAYERHVAPLSRDERDALWQDYKVVGRCFGLTDADLPAAIEDFDAYLAAMLEGDVLWVTDRAREVGRRIVLQPPVPLYARPVRDLVNFITVGTLPPRLRRGYRLGWDPARSLVLVGGREYARRLVVPLLPERLRYVPRARAARAA
jgi:uncharacterized protein (DUF2236 family)